MARLYRWLTGETSQQQSEEPTITVEDEREREELARRIHQAKQRLQMLEWQAEVESRWRSPNRED